jgi:hypothetical protein
MLIKKLYNHTTQIYSVRNDLESFIIYNLMQTRNIATDGGCGVRGVTTAKLSVLTWVGEDGGGSMLRTSQGDTP